MVLYVLSPWNENEHCITGDLSLVNDDDDGRLRSWRSLLLRHPRCVLSSPPASQNTARHKQGAQSGELDQRHTMSFHQCRRGATNCRHISVAPVAQSLIIQSHRGCPISASLLSTGDRGGRPGGHNHQSRPQERRLNTWSRLYRAMLAPAAAPPGRPRVFPQAEKTNPGGSNP